MASKNRVLGRVYLGCTKSLLKEGDGPARIIFKGGWIGLQQLCSRESGRLPCIMFKGGWKGK